MNAHAIGDATGIAMPASVAALREAPEAFLTRAMQAYGALPTDNRVVSVDRLEVFAGGNSGQKALLDVSYAKGGEALPRRLFAKFSRDFTDPFRDRRRAELDGEVRLATLSRLPAFPLSVPRPVFADFEAASGTGLLITERIAFGEGNIEPLHEKCMDHLLPDPLEYYRVLISAQARFTGAQHRGVLSPALERLFPYDRIEAEADLPIACGPDELRTKVAALGVFLAEHRQLFPAPLTDPAFPARLETEALAVLENEMTVRRFLQADPRLVAVCHWNTNIDNAWFWREADGSLHCGLLDWGMVRPMNVATGLWGGLSVAPGAFLQTELAGLLDHYRAELSAAGGPDLPADLLDLHFDLSLALTGLALMMDLPALVTARMPDIGRASGPLDPLIRRDRVVEGFLCATRNFLNLWACRDFGRSLRRLAKS
ncbi:hypothetical protein [Novosphingobium mangrovi (ex Huang et al. 2023)]|uniref:Aminoglycoside phosphotransferase domain-containing protein n=1 Tax=Novosphingobium mangrovi (ex Huang et al. 2023) TaxID=2976432 RepID=A0ABT2I630_9SPHN|nr:hypothetical protein [Novosphingobium mangrovi (ex Huang et al. 2023)]MCT2400270.1 hypothetical protein [Novosphingobium mangrovi (ex Huang et al. 2023)]